MAVTTTVFRVPDTDHNIEIKFDEDNLDWEPELTLLNHTTQDVRDEEKTHAGENFDASKCGCCKCFHFIHNWRGAATAKLLTNNGGRFRVRYTVET